MNENRTSAPAVYETIADGLADRDGNRLVRLAHGEWQAMRELVPDIDGETVLDAACGTGAVTERLLADGGAVVGIDASEASLAHARSRLGDEATFVRGDIASGLPFADESFEFVSCLLAVEHVEDWPAVCAEFARVLAPGGRLLVSTDHPFTTYHVIENEEPTVGSATATEADYYETERYEREWGETAMPCYRRSLAALVAPLTRSGLRLDALREPAPQTETEGTAYFGEGTPRFIVLRAVVPT